MFSKEAIPTRVVQRLFQCSSRFPSDPHFTTSKLCMQHLKILSLAQLILPFFICRSQSHTQEKQKSIILLRQLHQWSRWISYIQEYQYIPPIIIQLYQHSSNKMLLIIAKYSNGKIERTFSWSHTGKRQLPNLQTPVEHTMCDGKGKGKGKREDAPNN